MKFSDNKFGRVTSAAEAAPTGDTWFTAAKQTPFGEVEFSFVEQTDVAVWLDGILIDSLDRPAPLRCAHFFYNSRRLRQLRRLVRHEADELVLAHAIEQIADEAARSLALGTA